MAAALFLLVAGQAPAGEREIVGRIGYIAGETVYVDAGRSAGVDVGDSLFVVRDGRVIGTIVVINTASSASSCSPLFPVAGIRVGDEVSTSKAMPAGEPAPEEPAAGTGVEAPAATRLDHIAGSISLGSILAEDLTDSGLDFSRPSLSARFRIRDIGGKPVTLDVRHRTRYYGRERPVRSGDPEDRWTHQLYRLSLTIRDDEAPYQVRLGRFLPSMPRGIGYIDGLMLRYRLHEHIDFGVAGGFRPDEFSAVFRSDEKTIGAFTALDLDLDASSRLDLAAGFTGNYRSGTVDREFFVSEGTYTRGTRLSATGSVEIDLNRDWKGSAGERTLNLTRLYLGSRYRVDDDLSLHLSYDNRRPPRTIDNRATPDSLFDDSRRRGFRAGASWSATPEIQISGGAGVRYRDGTDNTFSLDASARLRSFPATGLVTTARFAMFRTFFSRGYRPRVELGLKPARNLSLRAGLGDTIYDTGGEKSHDPSIDSTLHYRINRRQFLTLRFTGHLSGRRRSARLSGETGYRF